MLNGLYGLSGGVMLAASFFSLLLPSFELAKEIGVPGTARLALAYFTPYRYSLAASAHWVYRWSDLHPADGRARPRGPLRGNIRYLYSYGHTIVRHPLKFHSSWAQV